MLNNDEIIKRVIDKVNYLNSPERNCSEEKRIYHAVKVNLFKNGYANCNRYMYRFEKTRTFLRKLEKLKIVKIDVSGTQFYATLINREAFEKLYVRNGKIPNDYQKLF